MSVTPFAQAFACILNAARCERGLSQEDLARASGLHRTYPSLLERGLRELKVSSFLCLCKGLGASPSKVLEDTLQLMRRAPLPKRAVLRERTSRRIERRTSRRRHSEPATRPRRG